MTNDELKQSLLSQRPVIKKLLSDLADIEQERSTLISLIRQTLTDDCGTVRIASQPAAKMILAYIRKGAKQ